MSGYKSRVVSLVTQIREHFKNQVKLGFCTKNSMKEYTVDFLESLNEGVESGDVLTKLLSEAKGVLNDEDYVALESFTLMLLDKASKDNGEFELFICNENF